MSWLQIFVLLWISSIILGWGMVETVLRMRSQEEYDPFAPETVTELLFLLFVVAFVIFPMIVVDQIYYMCGYPGIIDGFQDGDNGDNQ